MMVILQKKFHRLYFTSKNAARTFIILIPYHRNSRLKSHHKNDKINKRLSME